MYFPYRGGEGDGDYTHRSSQLHLALHGLHGFIETHGTLPEAGNTDHAIEVHRMAMRHNEMQMRLPPQSQGSVSGSGVRQPSRSMPELTVLIQVLCTTLKPYATEQRDQAFGNMK